jgi:hypothetical protein
LELEKRTVLQKKKPSYIYTGDATIDADRAQDAVMALPLPRLTRIESNRIGEHISRTIATREARGEGR